MSWSRSLIAVLVFLGLRTLTVAAPPAAGDPHARVAYWRSLDWSDPPVQKYVEGLEESEKQKAEVARTSENEDSGDRMLRRIQNSIMLTSTRQGGALTPTTERGVPWRASAPQLISSLGRIAWYGDMAQAEEVAEKTGRPLLIVSTELPGCGACVGHGQNQLSHPLVVDAALAFVPVVVSGGWPKLIFRDLEGRELAPIANHETSVAGTLFRMRTALEAANRPVPDWLELVRRECNPSMRETATFGMGCFWSGEKGLGRIDGILLTRCGSLQGEVVELQFDPAVVSYESLLKQAMDFNCARRVVARTEEQAVIAERVFADVEVVRSDDAVKLAPGGTKYSLKRNKVYSVPPH